MEYWSRRTRRHSSASAGKRWGPGSWIQGDVADPTDDDAADLDRRAYFQAADIIEMGAQGIGFSFRFETQTCHLQCQRQNGRDASQHESANQKFYFAELHLYLIQT
jgi:hypothetical protein